MYSITVQKHFDAAHFLREYLGKCGRLHGHRWLVQATYENDELDQFGMVIDFVDIKLALSTIIEEQFDHFLINNFPPFNILNPTAENIAKFFYDKLKSVLPTHPKPKSVRIYESPDCYSEYR